MANSSRLPGNTVAVLLGGGVESTALVRRFLDDGAFVVPIHVHCGLIWDDCERLHIVRFLEAQRSDRLLPLREVRLGLDAFLARHWAVTGNRVPREGDSSAELEIPLRNQLLLGFALEKLHDAAEVTLALGTTADNSYPDGSREYFDSCQQTLSLQAGRPVRIVTPLIELQKADVIRQSDRETLALSFSCVDPRDGRHCGACIKCGRRKAAFREAGVDDPTVYAGPSPGSNGAQRD